MRKSLRLLLAAALAGTLAVAAAPAHSLGRGAGADIAQAHDDINAEPKAPTVVDRAAAAGLAAVTKTWSANPIDYDKDGDEDAFIEYHQHSAKLWSNDGDATYTWVARSAWPRVNDAGKIPDRHDCAWADVDLDGRVDVYCSAGRNESNIVKIGMDNELWLQRSPGQFTEVGTAWGVGDVCGRGRHVAFLDANGDPYPDLFVGNSMPRPDPDDPCDNPANGYPNEESKLFLNVSGTRFSYAPGFYRFGAGPGQRCAEVLDFNSDGWDDLLACRLPEQTPRLYRNNAGAGFTEVGANRGLTTPIYDAVVVDFDRDGDGDIVTAALGEFAYRLNNAGAFGPSNRIAAVTNGEGRSVDVVDVDGDGDLDVYGMVARDYANPNDFLYLRNGTGWTSLNVPPAAGNAHEVVALHPRGPSARGSFLILNGGEYGDAGPIQLIEVVQQ
jgi:hypothetical protein